MQELIKELQEADATLENDGYKTWCYTRLAIAKAIEALQKPILDKANVSRRFDDERYEAELAAYLKDGIDYGANTIGKADQGDLEQLAADSFFAGYRAAVERLANGC
jgi:hypothetical protein